MQERDSPSGLLYGTAAYALWGVIPIYWRLLKPVPAIEVTLHRIFWCALCVGLLIAAQGRFAAVLRTLRDRKLLATLAATGTLLAVNWGIWIDAVESDQLVEASLGYYITPLISIALGVVLLGEKMNALRRFAVLLGLVAVLVQTAAIGRLPWIALALAASFGLYGYLRKTASIGALDGVFVESALLAPVALIALAAAGAAGTGAFYAGDFTIDTLLVLSGPVTASPLILFSAGARGMRLSTLGFLQYLSPSITLVLATLAFGEPFTLVHAASFGCIWLALALLALEKLPEKIRRRRDGRRRSASLPRA
jgi:chloramphenicol-sensitive protein RarD